MSAVMVVVLARVSMLAELMSVMRMDPVNSLSVSLGRRCLLERWFSERDLDIDHRWAKE